MLVNPTAEVLQATRGMAGKPLDGSAAGEKRLRPNDLGWLASSTSQPRKRKEIEGVSATSIVDLQAQLYRTQEHVRLKQGGLVGDKHLPRSSGFNVAALMEKRNTGVEARDQRDRVEVKTAAQKAADSYAALERKALIYDRLARGEADDGDERYEVDFLRKGGWIDHVTNGDGDDSEQPSISGRQEGAMMSADMARERERRGWEATEAQRLDEEAASDERRRQRREVIQGLAQETKEGRERAAMLRSLKEETTRQRQAKLKEAFLKKQMEKLIAAKNLAR